MTAAVELHHSSISLILQVVILSHKIQPMISTPYPVIQIRYGEIINIVYTEK